MIQIKAPDGTIAQFPDGTPDATVQAVMARHYGAPTPQMQRALADAKGFYAQGGAPSRLADQVVNGMTFGFSPEIGAAATAAGVGARNLVGAGPGYGMSDAYTANRDVMRSDQQGFAGRHPVAAPALQVLGAIKAPGVKTAGKFVVRAPNLLNGIVRSAATGGLFGAAYGAGAGGPGHRLAGAEQGAPVGAAVGGALPIVGAAVRPLLSAGLGVGADVIRGIRNTIRPPDPGAAPTAQDVDLARQKVQQMLLAARMKPGQLAAHPAAAAGKPITTAEAMGRTGINNLGALARRGGATGDALAPMLMDRSGNMPGRILGDFASSAGISPTAASGDMEALTHELRGQAKTLFDAALSERNPVWSTDLAKLAERPVIKKAIAAVGQDFLNAGQDPAVSGLKLDPDTGLHVLNPDLSAANEQQPTAATWDAVKKAVARQVERHPITGRVLPDSQSAGNFGVMSASRDLTSALAGDPANGVSGAIPGYRAALDKGGDYLQLEDAFQKGGKLITDPGVNEATFGAVHDGLDEASQHAFKAGFANKLYDLAQNGQLTPSRLKTPRIQMKLQTVLGPNADDFLNNVRLEGQMTANANRMMPGVNSPTFEFGNAAQEQDAAPGLAQLLAHAHLNPLKLLGSMASAGQAAARGPQVSNEMGRILMQPPAASASELDQAMPAPTIQGLFGAKYYPALAGQTASQFGN